MFYDYWYWLVGHEQVTWYEGCHIYYENIYHKIVIMKIYIIEIQILTLAFVDPG